MKKKKEEIEEKEADIFLKLNPEDSLEIKKSLLEITAYNINMQITAERFNELRRHEVKERGLARRNLTDASNSIGNLIGFIPKIKEIHPAVRIRESIVAENAPMIPALKIEKKTREDSLMSQLEDIKRRIASLK